MDVFAFDSLPRFATTTKTYVFFPDASMKSVVPMDATIITSVRETPIKKNDKWRCWSEAVAAFNRGERMPEPRYPIMIRKPGEETPLTAERLQKLAQLPVVPEVTKAPISDSLDGEDDMEVEIAEVSRGEWLLLCERTEFDSSECILFFDRETGETAKRSVMTVESIHDKWLASIEWEEGVERGQYEDEGTSVSSE